MNSYSNASYFSFFFEELNIQEYEIDNKYLRQRVRKDSFLLYKTFQNVLRNPLTQCLTNILNSYRGIGRAPM